MPEGTNSLGYQQITSLSSTQALTVPAGTDYALICSETQAVRWRDDGSDPTASVGVRLITTIAPQKFGGQLSRLKFIEETSSAKLNISYYGTKPPTA